MEFLGEKASVDRTLEMIKKTLKVKENLVTLTVSVREAESTYQCINVCVMRINENIGPSGVRAPAQRSGH